MQILTWVLVMISILAILTYAKLERFIDEQGMETLYLGQRQAEREADCLGQTMLYQHFIAYTTRPQTSKSPPKEPGNGPERPNPPRGNTKPPAQKNDEGVLHLDLIPRNSRLNLAGIFDETRKRGPPSAEGEFPFYQVAARLLRQLYQETPFFQKIPSAEYALLDALLAEVAIKKTDGKLLIKNAQELAQIQFDDPIVQDIFYHILKGGELVEKDRTETAYPSLLEFIYLEPNRRKFRINVHYASLELLAAALGDISAAEELVSLRESLHQEGAIVQKNGLRTTKIHLDEKKVRSVLESHHLDFDSYANLIDLSSKKPNASELLPDVYVKGQDATRNVSVKKKIEIKSSK